MATTEEIIFALRKSNKVGNVEDSKRLTDMYFKTQEVENNFNVPLDQRESKKPFTYDFERFNIITKKEWLVAPWSSTAVPRYKELISDYGYGDNFTAALLGNAAVESGGSFAANQKERGDKSATGRGIWQYTNETNTAYDKWLSINPDVKDGGWAQVKFMHKLLTGEIKNPKTGGAFLGDGHLKEFKKLIDNPKTTSSQYNDFILDVVMRPTDPEESRGRRNIYTDLFYEDIKASDNLEDIKND